MISGKVRLPPLNGQHSNLVPHFATIGGFINVYSGVKNFQVITYMFTCIRKLSLQLYLFWFSECILYLCFPAFDKFIKLSQMVRMRTVELNLRYNVLTSAIVGLEAFFFSYFKYICDLERYLNFCSKFYKLLFSKYLYLKSRGCLLGL